MIEQFITYEIALKLKELGFGLIKELGFGLIGEYIQLPYYYDLEGNLIINHIGVRRKNLPYQVGADTIDDFEAYLSITDNTSEDFVLAPLWQQAIDWFRVKYKINIEIIWLPNVSKYGIVVSDINYVPKLNDGNTNFIHGKDVTNNFVKFDMYEKAREQAILKAIELIKQSY